MPTQLSKIAFIEEANLSKTKVFSVFQEGAEGASRQVLSIEANSAIIENNRELITSKVYTIDVVGLYSQTDKSQLYTWASDRTELWVAGYGLDGSILQAQGTISVVDGYTDNASIRFRFQVESRGGYNATTGLHSANMSYAKNGLALYRWQEGITPNLAAGWAKTQSGSPSLVFTSSSQSFVCSGADEVAIDRRVYFPFVGQTLHFSFTATSVLNTTDLNFSITGFDSSDSSTGLDADSIALNLGAPTVNSVSLTIPANTIYVKVQVEALNDDAVTFTNPVLSLGSVIPFAGTEFNT